MGKNNYYPFKRNESFNLQNIHTNWKTCKKGINYYNKKWEITGLSKFKDYGLSLIGKGFIITII